MTDSTTPNAPISTSDAYALSFDPLRPARRKTRVVMVGHVPVGAEHPMVVQSMVVSDTMDTQAVIDEALGLAEVGCQIVRITAPTVKAAQNLKAIKAGLVAAGCDVPLVADIHFKPAAALEAAGHVEKVRINPGNFSDSKAFRIREYSDEQYAQEIARIEEVFLPLLEKCKARKVAMRIGTNHGSLSDRIMNRYGDSPRGMVESAMEFLRIARKHDYHDIILSMKASNPKIMIEAYRMLAAAMAPEGMDYPFHLGVTEAGDGEDGRIKSAIGIGALLEDGLGDTIRVSLTEDSIHEIPVARNLAGLYEDLKSLQILPVDVKWSRDLLHFEKRDTWAISVGEIVVGGEDNPVAVQVALTDEEMRDWPMLQGLLAHPDTPVEMFRLQVNNKSALAGCRILYDRLLESKAKAGLVVDVAETLELLEAAAEFSHGVAINLPTGFSPDDAGALIKRAVTCSTVLLLNVTADTLVAFDVFLTEAKARGYKLFLAGMTDEGEFSFATAYRLMVGLLDRMGYQTPVILRSCIDDGHGLSSSGVSLLSGSRMGQMICDGIGRMIEVTGVATAKARVKLVYNVLQASGARLTRTDYVACPSCGRTLFDLQSTTARVKESTEHLKGVRIAIMGCIVNGPGEMADADFGYVGGARGKINLYVGKDCVQTGIPSEEAVDRLKELIRSHGRWVDKK